MSEDELLEERPYRSITVLLKYVISHIVHIVFYSTSEAGRDFQRAFCLGMKA